MNNLFERVKNSLAPTSEEINKDLLDYHTKKPAITEKTLGISKTKDNKTSYEILLGAVPDYRNKTVLDLACGNGPLTRLLVKEYPEVRRIVGVDMCESDLQLARSAIKNPKVEFRCESAGSLSLSNASVDVVLSHMALMLFRPVEPAIQEISRVLVSGGLFAAMISNFGEGDPLFSKVISVLGETVSKTLPHLSHFHWGDKRVLSDPGLAPLFSEKLGFEKDFEVQKFDFYLMGPPAELAEKMGLFFYSFGLLGTNDQKLLLGKWKRIFEAEINEGGKVSLAFPLKMVKIKKKG